MYRLSMDALKHEDLGDIWTKHFPHRKRSEASRILLETAIGAMLQRKEFRNPNKDFEESLDEVLEILHIPRHEFYEFEREMEPQKTKDAND